MPKVAVACGSSDTLFVLPGSARKGVGDDGGGAEDTLRVDREAFYRWRLRPSTLRDVDERDLPTSVLAPAGVLSTAHKEADLASAGLPESRLRLMEEIVSIRAPVAPQPARVTRKAAFN